MKSLATFDWKTLLLVSKGQESSHYRRFNTVTLTTDTRTLEPGTFFVPLTGENFDGNEFIELAYEKGAEGTFVSRKYLETHPELKRFPNLIQVDLPLLAYLSLAGFHRSRSQAKVIAITGSSGKTTTKEMLYTLLETVSPGATQCSEKNFNNEVGVARTLLGLKPETEYLILEMGMRGLGEIALLSQTARPDLGIITNIGPAHIGRLGSLKAIYQAKCEIFAGMDSASGWGVINEDDPCLAEEVARVWPGHLETFSLHDVENIHTRGEGLLFDMEEVTFHLGMPGAHNVMNALSGIRACEILGVPLKKITKALAEFKTLDGRWEKMAIPGSSDLWVIHDAYNANPASMKVALTTFLETPFVGHQELPLKKVAVLGGMAELGDMSEKYHSELGQWLNTKDNLAGLVIVGEEAAPIAKAMKTNTFPTYAVTTVEEVLPLIGAHWQEDVIILLKASRQYHLEAVTTALRNMFLPHALS